MKFLRLDLKAIGPFRDQALDLSAGEHGFHLIVGENEAGKTSACGRSRTSCSGFRTWAATTSCTR